MSLNKNKLKPPDTMTWKRAMPVLILCGVFDIARAFFSMFWLFGPAIASMYCVGGSTGIWGKVLSTVCSGAGAVAGYFLSPALMFFGTIMAMAIGLVGWMLVYLILVMSNLRIFQVGAGSVLTMIASLAVGEAPLLNALPALTLATGRLYRAQIKREHAELKDWKKAHAAQLQQERVQQRTQLMQAQQARAKADEELAEEAKAQTEQESAYSQNETRSGDGAEESEQDRIEETAETQFETMKDALSELNAKQNRTLEENNILLRAREIMLRGALNQNEHDPVLRAAYERAAQGQEVFDGSPETRNGFVFNNLRKTSSVRNLS